MSYKIDVESFAREYGYAFLTPGQSLDPSAWESWVENSDIVFRKIAAINRCESHTSLITLHCAAEDAFRQTAAEMEKIIGPAKKANFEKTLRLARGWLALGNECEIAIGTALTRFRKALTDLGKSLLDSKAIANLEDVFNLSIDEISKAEAGEIAALVAQRKHDIWLEDRLTAPDFLPSDAVACSSESDVLTGSTVFPGCASGRVRRARCIEDAGEIEPGEILVVDCATLAWTPFLAVADGFISESGSSQPGVESIIRTYCKPAIVGCKGIMDSVKDGDRITIDGLMGIIQTTSQIPAMR